MDDDLPRDETIALRQWTRADAQWYADSSRDPDIQRFTSDPPDLTAADVARAIDELAGRSDRDGFVICAADSGRRLGNLAVEYAGPIAEISYWVAPEGRGQGLAARTLSLLAAWLPGHRDVVELALWAHVDNAGSRRAAERAGFVRDETGDRPRTVKGQLWPTVAYRRPVAPA